jgi:plastocyanin
MRSLILFVAAAIALAGCGGGGSSGSKAPASLSGQVTNKGTVTVSGSSVTIDAQDFAFKPTFVKAAPGTKLTVKVVNQGQALHTFTAPTAHVDMQVASGKTVTATVTVPASGSLNFYCRFHRGIGMQGAIVAKS